jgi:hypothetical protein
LRRSHHSVGHGSSACDCFGSCLIRCVALSDRRCQPGGSGVLRCLQLSRCKAGRRRPR